MSTDQDVKKPQPAPKQADAPKAAAPAAKKPDEPFSLEERKLGFDELKRNVAQLDPAKLVDMLMDGRATVRANAALGLAATGQAVAQLVPLLRDSEAAAAAAAAEAIARLGRAVQPLVVDITKALDTAQPDITDKVVGALADLIGYADDELTLALDVTNELAMKSVVAAARKVGKAGVACLIPAARHQPRRIRLNAVDGLPPIGQTEPDTPTAFPPPPDATPPAPA